MGTHGRQHGGWKYPEFPCRKPREQFHGLGFSSTTISPRWMFLRVNPCVSPVCRPASAGPWVTRVRRSGPVPRSLGGRWVAAVPSAAFTAICSASAVSSASCLHGSSVSSGLRNSRGVPGHSRVAQPEIIPGKKGGSHCGCPDHTRFSSPVEFDSRAQAATPHSLGDSDYFC